MKAMTALLTGLAFGVVGVALPLAQSRLGAHLPLYVQPVLAVCACFVAGVVAGIRHGREGSGSGRMSGHAWIGLMIAVSSVTVAVYTYVRSLAGLDHFFVELQLFGLVLTLCPAYLGYGVGRIVRARDESPDYDRRR